MRAKLDKCPEMCDQSTLLRMDLVRSVSSHQSDGKTFVHPPDGTCITTVPSHVIKRETGNSVWGKRHACIVRPGTMRRTSSRVASRPRTPSARSPWEAWHAVARTEGGSTTEVATGDHILWLRRRPGRGPGLYEVYTVPMHTDQYELGQGGSLGMVMVDPGSDTTFVRHKFARKLGLIRRSLSLSTQGSRPRSTPHRDIKIPDGRGGLSGSGARRYRHWDSR